MSSRYKINGNEPAAPLSFSSYEEAVEYKGANPNGLTIRQQFAAMCLQGILSNQALYDAFYKSGKHPNIAPEFYALVAVEHADALINELNKPS